MADDHRKRRRVIVGAFVGVSAVVAVVEEVGNRASGVWTVEHVVKWVPKFANELGPKAGMEASIALGVSGVLLLAVRRYIAGKSEDLAHSRMLHHVRGLGIIALALSVFLAFSLPHKHAEPPKKTAKVHKGHHHNPEPRRKPHSKGKPSKPSTTGLTAEAGQGKASEPVATTASCGCKQAAFSAPGGEEHVYYKKVESEPESESEPETETETETTASEPPDESNSSSVDNSTVESTTSATTTPAASSEQSQSQSQSGSSSSSASSSSSSSVSVSEG